MSLSIAPPQVLDGLFERLTAGRKFKTRRTGIMGDSFRFPTQQFHPFGMGCKGPLSHEFFRHVALFKKTRAGPKKRVDMCFPEL